MGVAGQILQHMLGSTKGRLRVDDLLSAPQASKQRVKGARRRQCRQLASEAYLAAPEALLEKAKQLAAEHAAEHAHWKEEPVTVRGDPAGVIERQSTGRNETVQVRMKTPTARVP